MDNYQLSSETVNDKAFYISEGNFGKFGIWYCSVNSQWFIGLTEEKGQCQGYAYTNGSSSCLCGSSFGWRFIQKKSFTYWKLAKRLSFSIECNDECKSYNQIHLIKSISKLQINFLAFRERIMVIGGTTKVEGEVFHLTNENSVCDTTISFERWGAVGAVLGKDIVVCGGKSKIGGRHSTCTVIHQSNNVSEIPMLERRYGASSVAINETALWIVGKYLHVDIEIDILSYETNVSGGNNGSHDLATSEFISTSGDGTVKEIDLPFTINFHCTTQLSSTKIIIIGGKQDGVTSRQTWIADITNGNVELESGPIMNNERQLMSCGRMTIEQGQTRIVVAGGKDVNGATHDSVEILDLTLNVWSMGK